MRFIENTPSKEAVEKNPRLKAMSEQYAAVQKTFDQLLKDLGDANDKFYKDMRDRYGNAFDDAAISSVEKEDNVSIKVKRDYVADRVLSPVKGLPVKIKSLYRLNYNLMEIIFDSQFFLLYVIKGLRILFSYIALFLATRVFSPMYESAVYDSKQNPPSLWKYMLIYVGFDLSFNAFLIVLLYILKLLFKTDDNSFIVDKYLFSKYMVDYVVSVSVIVLIGVLMSRVITNKKFFKYKYEGVRAIRAFENMMFNSAIVLHLFPFFLMA